MYVTGSILASKFVPYGPTHWLIIVALGTVSVLLALSLRRSLGTPHEALARRALCGGLATILLGGAVLAQVQRVASGSWTLQESLPLHLCDIGVLVNALALIFLAWPARFDPSRIAMADAGSARGVWGPRVSLEQRLYELSYVWGIGGTTQSILTPDVEQGFPDVVCIRYFILHGAIIISVLVMTLGLRMRPRAGAFRRVWWATFAMAVLVFGIDAVLRAICPSGEKPANYMYLFGPPEHDSLYNYFGPWPWSLLSLVAVGTVLIGLTCLPFAFADRRRRARQQPPTSPSPDYS